MGKVQIKDLESAVIKFAGDSGDGMQLTGTLFSDDAAIFGNDIVTFPDYPAEIRAPHNTVAGVSGFQVHMGRKKVYTPGDTYDVLVAMNPASIKANLKGLRKGSIIITDTDAFTDKALETAGYASNPLVDQSLADYTIIKAPIITNVKEAVAAIGLDNKSAERSKNMYVLGILYCLFNRNLESTFHYFEYKFKEKLKVLDANKAALTAGYEFALECSDIKETYRVHPASLEKGRYRNVTGNVATAWGLIAAAERSGLQLFLGSYPITPATEILVELSKHKSLGVKVFQAEDEIAGICSAIGASFAGSLAITTTSGPGLSLKSEAIGLAVMTELPLVIVDVQRAGPSTGLPTKSEQSDLMQALFGRNGEAPIIIIAASSPANCFYYAFEAARLAVEHMTPVMLLTDGYLGNGSELFKIIKTASLPKITPNLAKPNEPNFKPYNRDAETLVRKWAAPGTEGLRHRIGGLEKDYSTSAVSTDPINHEKMVKTRAAKVEKVAEKIPDQIVHGEKQADLLIVSWGSTEGFVKAVVDEMIVEKKSVGFTNFNYIMPLPKNTADLFSKYKKIIVCENNMGQFADYLRMKLPQFSYIQYNKVQGTPFTMKELHDKFNEVLEDLK